MERPDIIMLCQQNWDLQLGTNARNLARGGRRNRRQMRPEDFEAQRPFNWRENLVISWTGMRGVVTLAAAAGIPLTTLAGEAFPGRDAIQVVAFTVTIGTLLIQGLTLPWLIGWLKLSDPHEAEHHLKQRKLANDIGEAAVQRAMTAYRETHPDPKVGEAVDQMLQRMIREDDADEQVAANNGALMLELGRVMLEARRAALILARDDRRLDDDILREVLEGLDLQQAMLANWTANGGRS